MKPAYKIVLINIGIAVFITLIVIFFSALDTGQAIPLWLLAWFV